MYISVHILIPLCLLWSGAGDGEAEAVVWAVSSVGPRSCRDGAHVHQCQQRSAMVQWRIRTLKRPQTALNGLKRPQTASNGLKWLQTASNGLKRASNGLKRPQTASNGLKRPQTHHLVICTNFDNVCNNDCCQVVLALSYAWSTNPTRAVLTTCHQIWASQMYSLLCALIYNVSVKLNTYTVMANCFLDVCDMSKLFIQGAIWFAQWLIHITTNKLTN